MITQEQLEQAFGDDRNPFRSKKTDHGIRAVSLLRERIPFDVVPRILVGAEHDQIWLPHVDQVIPYISEEDLEILADCNVCYDSGYESLFLFV